MSRFSALRLEVVWTVANFLSIHFWLTNERLDTASSTIALLVNLAAFAVNLSSFVGRFQPQPNSSTYLSHVQAPPSSYTWINLHTSLYHLTLAGSACANQFLRCNSNLSVVLINSPLSIAFGCRATPSSLTRHNTSWTRYWLQMTDCPIPTLSVFLRLLLDHFWPRVCRSGLRHPACLHLCLSPLPWSSTGFQHIKHIAASKSSCKCSSASYNCRPLVSQLLYLLTGPLLTCSWLYSLLPLCTQLPLWPLFIIRSAAQVTGQRNSIPRLITTSRTFSLLKISQSVFAPSVIHFFEIFVLVISLPFCYGLFMWSVLQHSCLRITFQCFFFLSYLINSCWLVTDCLS